ncbi:MAG: hypothetical protein ACI87E_001248 [Mariniblastus sp.]|jgi:hypothetical protein
MNNKRVTKIQPLSRRAVLQGIGATIALPWLEAMSFATPLGAHASSRSGLPVAAGLAPKRLAFMYIPNGVIGDQWFPAQAGTDFELPPSLQPLAKLRDDITVISGLDRTYLTGEPHSQAGACWLTSARPNERVDGVNAIDTTLDQVIASSVGQATPFASVELSCNSFEDNMEPKIFDAISWYGPGNDAKSQNDPRRVFKRLFGDAGQVKRSVLDTVLEDAKQLEKSLGEADRQKLDEYLTSLRSVEQRLTKQDESKGKIGPINYSVPDDLPTNRGAYIRMMGDLMVLAFQTDQTRVASLMVGPERWETPQLYDGVFDKPVNHHVMTHDTSQNEAVAKIDRFHVDQYAYLVNRLKSMKEGEGTLLDSCSFVLGSGLGNGARHSYEQLPVIIAGSGNGSFETGRHLAADKGTRLANLWMSMASVMGVELDEFADGTGKLAGFLN